MKNLTVGELKKILLSFTGSDDAPIAVLVREYTRAYPTWVIPQYWDSRCNGAYSGRDDMLLIAANFQSENDDQYVSTSIRKK